MARWKLRRKTTRRFRSSRAYKQDARQVSNEPWERRRSRSVVYRAATRPKSSGGLLPRINF